MDDEPIILSARRTIVAPRHGALASYDIGALAAPVSSKVLLDAGLLSSQVDEIIVSNALAGGGNPARYCALAAGLPQCVGGISIDRQCVGGLDAFNLGAAMIKSGQARIVIVGGVESHSTRPIRMKSVSGIATPLAYDRPAFAPTADNDPDPDQAMADLADYYGLDQAEQDAWAIKSHETAVAHKHAVASEIVAIGNSGNIDTYARNLSQKVCARAQKIHGSITFANTAVSADAAAFAVMVAPRVARDMRQAGVTFIAGKTVGGDPRKPALAPVSAINAVLAQTNLSPFDIDQTEMMEAYAAQAILCCRLSGLNPNAVNMKGGALARGHPIGASGAILAVRLFHDLMGTTKTGLAAIAAAGGLGTATVFSGRG
jgi:acetyl-CoA C-acetyltransferase